jgi:hypothetical protein
MPRFIQNEIITMMKKITRYAHHFIPGRQRPTRNLISKALLASVTRHCLHNMRVGVTISSCSAASNQTATIAVSHTVLKKIPFVVIREAVTGEEKRGICATAARIRRVHTR